MAELANYFARKPGLSVHLIIFGSIHEVYYPLSDRVTVHVPGFRYHPSRRFPYYLRTMLFVRRRVKALKPGAVLSLGEIWNSFVLLSLYGLKYPVFISDRCQPGKEFGRLHSLLRRLLYPRADGMIAQTEVAGAIYRREFKKLDIAVIGNPIREFAVPDHKKAKEDIVLSVGRLIPTKNQKELIDLFLQTDMPGWKLVIVGGDTVKQPLTGQLQAYIHERGAQERVSLEGEQPGVDGYYLKSRIFAFTSSSEGFPNVIGEAQSAGLPVVAFDCVAGPSEMVADGKNGFLVPLYDYDRFRTCLQMLMESGELRDRMGRYARESIGKYSIGSIGEAYLSFMFGKSDTLDR